MALPITNSAIWEEIELSESYLVCCMFEKAASLASSVLERILKSDSLISIQDIQLSDMMESAGMVLVQSLKEQGRTSEMLRELKILFGTVTNIPIQVLLTGACFQISDGSYSGLCEFLYEFLSKWRYVDGQSYVLSCAEQNGAYLKGCNGNSVLEIDKYLEVVEVYAITLLGRVLNDTELAIAWTEKAELPEEKRQELIRRLRSLYSLKATNSSQNEETPLLADTYEGDANSGMESTVYGVEKISRASKIRTSSNGGDNRKQTVLKFSERMEPCLWWFRMVSLKFGNSRLVISHGKIVLWGPLIIFFCYILQKKRASLKRIASKQALSVKKALIDMWQLAFSVQVNPLAAVQPIPTAPRGNRG